MCDNDECTLCAFIESDCIFTGPVYIDTGDEDEDEFDCNYIIEDEDDVKLSCADS